VASSRLGCSLIVAVTSAAGEECRPRSSDRCPQQVDFGVKGGSKPNSRDWGFTASARTVTNYMISRHSRGPSSDWRKFLKRYESSIWACDFFRVQTILSQTLYAFCSPARKPGSPARCGSAISHAGSRSEGDVDRYYSPISPRTRRSAPLRSVTASGAPCLSAMTTWCGSSLPVFGTEGSRTWCGLWRPSPARHGQSAPRRLDLRSDAVIRHRDVERAAHHRDRAEARRCREDRRECSRPNSASVS
jgi:hypothetical protein